MFFKTIAETNLKTNTKLKIYDSAQRKKVEFIPLNPPFVKMYCCGPTVYDFLHIGNFRGAVFYNFVRNWLEFLNYKVKYIYNFTDVDDKILNRAKEKNVKPGALANKFIDEFKKDYQSLELTPPTHTPKATETIKEIIQLVQTLINKGLAYQSGGDVFYSVKSFASYGSLSGKNIEELIAGARVEINSKKKDPMDFALWKEAKPEETWFWESPWGLGRPGWHIECTAMIHKYLGQGIDIHGGGMDLIFPHHENEKAQSEGICKEPYVRFWIHNNMLALSGDKMSKSRGNLITLREFLREYPGEVFKYLMLSSHYRSIVNFSQKTTRQALASLGHLYSALSRARKIALISDNSVPYPVFEKILKQKEMDIEEAFNDDFATPRALSLFFDLLREFEEILKKKIPLPERAWCAERFSHFFQKYGQIMSLFQEKQPDRFLKNIDDHILYMRKLSRKKIDEIVQERERAREVKNFKEADRLRRQLEEWGILVQDSPEGTTWEVQKDLAFTRAN